jgi:hypothetical protein
MKRLYYLWFPYGFQQVIIIIYANLNFDSIT